MHMEVYLCCKNCFYNCFAVFIFYEEKRAGTDSNMALFSRFNLFNDFFGFYQLLFCLFKMILGNADV